MDAQADRVQTASEPGEVHIEGVAGSWTGGPAGASQCLTGDDRPHLLEEQRREPRLEWGEGDPVVSHPQHAFVERGPESQVLLATGDQAFGTGLQVGLRRRKPDPILEAVAATGRRAAAVDEEQPGLALTAQPLPPTALGWPAEVHDIHAEES